MSRKSYNFLTTASLITIAVSAVISDRIPGYGWAFGGLAGACALVSAWAYLKHGMTKDRGKTVASVSEAGNAIAKQETRSSVQRWAFVGRENIETPQHADIVEYPGKPRMLIYECKSRGADALLFASYSHLLIQSFYRSKIEMPRQKSFAEEVVEIVKALAALGETPRYEIEFKSDGTLRLAPCHQDAQPVEGSKSIPDLDSAKITNRFHN